MSTQSANIFHSTDPIITDRAEAEQLIADLRSAVKRSLRTGGRYYVRLPGGGGLALHLNGVVCETKR